MKYELNCSYNCGGVAYLLHSVDILFNLTVGDLTLWWGCQKYRIKSITHFYTKP